MSFDIRLTIAVLFCVSIRFMNSFNKTEAAVFSCRLCFLRAFPFISLIIIPFLIERNCTYAQYNDTGISATDFTEIYGDGNHLLNSPQVLNVPNER